MPTIEPAVGAGAFAAMFSICATLIIAVYRDNRQTVTAQAEQIRELEAMLKVERDDHATARQNCERQKAVLVGALARLGEPIPPDAWGGNPNGAT